MKQGLLFRRNHQQISQHSQGGGGRMEKEKHGGEGASSDGQTLAGKRYSNNAAGQQVKEDELHAKGVADVDRGKNNKLAVRARSAPENKAKRHTREEIEGIKRAPRSRWACRWLECRRCRVTQRPRRAHRPRTVRYTQQAECFIKDITFI